MDDTNSGNDDHGGRGRRTNDRADGPGDDFTAHFALIARVSAGDMDAYDAMYRQYVASATRVARTVANTAEEATDVVFEAFARLLVRLREDGEPPVGIEAHLRTTIRRLAIQRHPDVTQSDVAAPHPDDPMRVDDRFARVRAAFEALPDEWQQILWHAEVERKAHLALSRGLEMSQSTVASLVLRSREGLRQAYGAMALADHVADDCRDFAPNIAVHVKGMLPAKVGRELDRHLRRCPDCQRFRDDYVLMLSDLRPTLFAALLRPADPAAVPVAAELDGEQAGPDDATVEVPVAEPVAEHAVDPALAVAMIGQLGREADPASEAVPVAGGARQRRRRAILAGGIATVAAATLFVAFMLVGPGSDPPPGDGFADGASGLAAGGNAQPRVLGAGPTVDVLSGATDDAGVPGSGSSSGAGFGDDSGRTPTWLDDLLDGGDNSVDSGDSSEPSPPRSPQPGDTPSDTPSGPSTFPTSTPSTDPTVQGEPPMPPSFFAHPQSVSAAPGETAAFTVDVDGNPEPKIRWQQRGSSSASWTSVANATSPTLQVRVTNDSDGRQYRAVATNEEGTATSDSATLTVEFPPPSVTAHPQNATAEAGGDASFTASASSEIDFTEVWWEEKPSGGSWSRMNVDVPAAEKTSLTVSNVQPSRDGSQFRAVFSNGHGTTASNSASLTVTE